MKQLQKVLNEALTLVGDNYIIFNDGKAVQVNTKKDVSVEVDNYFDGNDFYKYKKSELENEIEANAPFTTSVIINEDVDLTVIFINDDVKYLNYNFLIKENVKANINHLYFKVANEIKTKVDILCEDYSHVMVKNIMQCEGQVTALVNAYCLSDAYIKLDTLGLNDKEASVYTNVYLVGENTDADLTNVLINSSSLTQNYQYKINHITHDSKSLTNNYGICKNSSNIVMDCHGIIKKNAKKTVLSQKSKGILLDMYSKMSAQPLLVIDENDVIANHGASIGAIDDNDLYYLMSRGLTREESEKLIVLAFINPYFRGLNDEKITGYLNKEIKKHL